MRVFVVDNPDEVRKFVPYAGKAELLLRVSFRSPGAVCDLSRKFGCDPENAVALARLAAELGIEVRGLSFHVGSQAADAGKHVEAIEACAKLLAACAQGKARRVRHARHRRRLPHRLHEARAGHRAVLRADPCGAREAAEAGAHHRGAGQVYCWALRHRRGLGDGARAARGTGGITWTMGLYGSYSGQIYDHARYPVEPLQDSAERLPSVLAGPTCDSIDVIAENLMLPELKAGDLIVGRAMGAYTWASASDFNFFPKATVVAVNETPGDTGSVSNFPLSRCAGRCLLIARMLDLSARASRNDSTANSAVSCRHQWHQLGRAPRRNPEGDTFQRRRAPSSPERRSRSSNKILGDHRSHQQHHHGPAALRAAGRPRRLRQRRAPATKSSPASALPKPTKNCAPTAAARRRTASTSRARPSTFA